MTKKVSCIYPVWCSCIKRCRISTGIREVSKNTQYVDGYAITRDSDSTRLKKTNIPSELIWVDRNNDGILDERTFWACAPTKGCINFKEEITPEDQSKYRNLLSKL